MSQDHHTTGFRAMLATIHQSNLKRVLYISRHDKSTTHLPLYEAAEQYEDVVKGTNFGSYLHSVKLSAVEKSRGDDMSVRVEYLVDLKTNGEKGDKLQVQYRTIGHDHSITVNALIPPTPGAESLLVLGQYGFDAVPMTVSFPIEPSIRGDYRIPHPFTFCLSGENNQPGKAVQWQVHPGPNSLFRYTLVDIGASENGEPRILAIYVHVGIVVCLPAEFSEGVLLLPESSSREEGTVVIASLLVMLRQLREEKQMQRSKNKECPASSNLVRRVATKLWSH